MGYGNFLDYQNKLQALEEQKTHFVRWGALNEDHAGVVVGSNNYQGGKIVTEHLIDQGHQHFVFVGGADSNCPEFLERFSGFNDALVSKGILKSQQAAKHWDAISTEMSGYNVGKALIASGAKVDAIVCASDLIAIGVLSALKESGLNVPGDIAVVGYDNIPLAPFTSPPLTTVRQNTKLAGELLVNRLISQIEGKDTQSHLIDAELVIRQSCGNGG